MLAPDQRDAFAEALAVQVDQRGAMPVLLVRHAVEDGGRGGKGVAQAIGIGAVDAAVIFFRGDRERQDFLFGQRRKGPSAEAENTRKHDDGSLA